MNKIHLFCICKLQRKITKKVYRQKRNIKKRVKVIKNYLIRGDMIRIATITGFQLQYVRMVLSGYRYNRQILETALQIAKENKKIGYNLQTINQ